MVEQADSDYYVKLGLAGEFNNGLSNISYLMKEWKRTRNAMHNFRQQKAQLRKEFYETLISLRLNMDKLKSHLPEHEARKLMKKIEDIKKYAKEKKKKKEKEKSDSKKTKLMKDYEKETGNHAIWRGRVTKQFKEWKDEKEGKSPEKKEKKTTPNKKKKKQEIFPEKKEKEDPFKGALESEKKELELLRQDLENISKELKKRK
jgi:hypothetical protein